MRRVQRVLQKEGFCCYVSGRESMYKWGVVNVIYVPTEHQGVHKNSFRNVRAFQNRIGSNWNLEMLAFKERGKPVYPEENPLEQSREPRRNSRHRWRQVRESNPGHISWRRALWPLRHPCSVGVAMHVLRIGLSRFLTGKRSVQKLECLYRNLMANTFFQNGSVHNLRSKMLKYYVEDCIHQVWRM